MGFAGRRLATLRLQQMRLSGWYVGHPGRHWCLWRSAMRPGRLPGRGDDGR